MRNLTRTARSAAAFLTLGLLLGGCASALEYAGNRLDQELTERTEKNIDRAVEGGADRIESGTENAVRCALGDDACAENARAQGKAVQVVDDNGNVVSTSGAAGVGAVNANYDFVPGERTLFAADFASDNVGDFPRGLEFVSGNMSVVQAQGKRLLQSTGQSVFRVDLPQTLPERFTIEFDLMIGSFLQGVTLMTLPFDGPPRNYHDGNTFVFSRGGVGVGGEPSSSTHTKAIYELTPVKIMVDGGYAKVYMGTERMANIPNASFERTNTLQFYIEGSKKEPSYIGNIRVAGGGRDLYDALSAEGRVATRGILFATGSDQIQPASATTLQQIGTMLQQHSDLRLTIEGHTDNVGDAAANQKLSEQRAAAVKQYMVRKFGIDASRLQAVGRGASQPVASNDTAEGRQQNRRVELVRN